MSTTGELKALNGQVAALERAKTEADQEMQNELLALRDKNAALEAELKSAMTTGANGSAMDVGVSIFRDDDQSAKALLARIPDDVATAVRTRFRVTLSFEDPHVEAAFQATYVCTRACFGCALINVCCRPKGELFFAP